MSGAHHDLALNHLSAVGAGRAPSVPQATHAESFSAQIAGELAPVWQDLVDVHERLDAVFARHQEAFVEGDLAEAADRFHEFRALLREHMEREEACLLPAYLENPAPPRGADVEVFRAEHRQIGEYVDALAEVVERWADGTRLSSCEVVRLIEGEKVLKHLLEHHDRRERLHLYSWLNRFDPEGQRVLAFGDSERSEAHAV